MHIFSFTLAHPWEEANYKGCNSRYWLSIDKEKKAFLFWRLNFEKEEFELAKECRLPSALVSELPKETPGGLDNALVVFDKPYYQHVIIETNATVRVLSIQDNSPDIVAIIALKPEAPFNYILSQTTLMSATIEDDLSNKKMKLSINIHDLEARHEVLKLTQEMLPAVAQLDSCAMSLNIKGTLDDRFNLVVLSLLDNDEFLQEYFYFVIDVKDKRVHSRGWSSWKDASGRLLYRHLTKFQVSETNHLNNHMMLFLDLKKAYYFS